MPRPNYMSIYAEEKTQKIFNQFTNIKGITKTAALTDILEIYMISQDEDLYLELKKKEMNIESAKRMILERNSESVNNDYIFMKLGVSSDTEGNALDGDQTMEAYIKNIRENGYDYSWFSTQSLFFGMSQKKVDHYNNLIKRGEIVKMLFAIGGEVNDIQYSANVEEISSSKDQQKCPDGEWADTEPTEFRSDETARIWIKFSKIEKETEIKAAMLMVRSTGANLKQVITNSQFHFGYVCLK